MATGVKGRKRYSYHLRWIDPSTRKWRSEGVGKDKRVAEREAARREDELRRGVRDEIQEVAWAAFIDDHIAKMPAGENRNDTERTLRTFGETCEPVGPHTITYGMLEKFGEHLRARGNSNATINKRLRYVRRALRMAKKRGNIARNPMEGWDWGPEEEKLIRQLTAEEKRKLLDACPTHQWRTFIVVALTTGCRKSELLGLTWDRIDLDEPGRIVLTRTKTHKDRVQPLPDQAVAMLRELQAKTLRDGGPFFGLGTRSSAHHKYRRIVKAAGIAHCTIHDLRRTFCSDLAADGVNQRVCQELAGRTCPSTTAKYYQNIADPTKRDSVSRLARFVG